MNLPAIKFIITDTTNGAMTHKHVATKTYIRPFLKNRKKYRFVSSIFFNYVRKYLRFLMENDIKCTKLTNNLNKISPKSLSANAAKHFDWSKYC